jgi:hypothetical protein
MRLNCKHVWRELSNYLDADVSESVRRDIEAHVSQCRHCAALLDSTHNVLVLVADERRMEIPVGFNARLRERLEREMAAARPL